MKRKILFVLNSLSIGGSEKSLISLLNTLDYSKYEVDLMMFKTGEILEKYVPSEVNILDEPEYYRFLGKKIDDIPSLKRMRFIRSRINTSIALRLNSKKKNNINTEQVLYKNQKKCFDKLEKKYDVAIAYSQGMPTYFVADKIDANKKIAWINCDYKRTMYDKELDKQFYKKIDKIVAVSNFGRESIIEVNEEYKNKIEVVFDIVNPQIIEKMSNEEIKFKDKSNINILTVARLVSHYKGYDIAIKAAKLLKNNGYKFKWYVVGEGPDRLELENMIVKNNIEDYFILLGERENPYPYMKNCDIYVQSSRKEGLGLTVVEAKILKKPIVCTNFETTKEIINNNIDGLIVDIDEKSLYEGIKRLIDDKTLRDKIQSNLNAEKSYNSTNEIDKIYSLIG